MATLINDWAIDKKYLTGHKLQLLIMNHLLLKDGKKEGELLKLIGAWWNIYLEYMFPIYFTIRV